VTPLNTEQPIEHVGGAPVIRRAERLVVVVGFDGSSSSYRALDASALLISGRPGSVEVVYLAHVAPVAEMSTEGMSELLKAFDSAELEFADVVRDRFSKFEFRWRFRRCDGPVADELVVVADELSGDDGADSRVVIVVGGAEHSLRHIVGSVPTSLVRNAKYPVVIIP
jgi:nucleotide-binding universal stress UspA family protein